MKKRIELLAPGGDIDSIKAAILAGADAIYCGLERFNARNRAENIPFADLNGIVRLAHSNGCEVFLTLNIIIVESEIPALVHLLNTLINTRIDGVIVQDLGLLYLLSQYFPELPIHGSTQLTTHNEGQIQFLSKLNVSRVNLSRELNLHEIQVLTEMAHQYTILTEVFVHGSNCISFSGICYLSSVNGGNSGNRGRCSQPCRDQYETTTAGVDFPLNLKDNSAYSNLRELADAGVDSVKIEGRIKKFHYVYTVVRAWRKELQALYNGEVLSGNKSELYKVFNRAFSNAFLTGTLDKGMFIDNPRDNSAIYLAERNGGATAENIEEAKGKLYDLRTGIITDVARRIEGLSIAKAPLTLMVSGEPGKPLKVSVKTPETAFVVFSDMDLVRAETYSATNSLDHGNKKNSGQYLNHEMLLKRFVALNDTEYFIEDLELENLQKDLFIPFKELTSMKKKILFILNDSRDTLAPIAVPPFNKQGKVDHPPSLSLLISSEEDLHLCHETSAEIYFQLPDSLANESSHLVDLFKKNKKLIPWFPSVLIGEDYHAALDFLQQVRPKCIVTNNTGVAHAAYQCGISWIAGPYLNCVNSYSLLCLKEKLNCSGAFVSNEISKNQIKRMKKPDNFKLYYSIYHPISLMTSRQCLFHQVTGCEKVKIDENCLQRCERSSAITNLKNISLLLKKTKGNYHGIYSATHFLNTDIVTDIPNVFSSFFVDLRGIATSTKREMGKATMVKLFAQHLAGNPGSTEALKQGIHPSTSRQYEKGI